MIKGEKHSEESKAKMRGPRMISESGLAAMIAASTGRVISDETRHKMSVVQIGHVVTESTRSLISVSHKGKPLPESHKAAMRAAWEKRKARGSALVAARKERDLRIVEEFKAGRSRIDLAEKYGCSNDNISRICREAGIWREAWDDAEKRASRLASKKKYRESHPERVALQLKRCQHSKPVEYKKTKDEWKKRNLDKVRLYSSTYQSRRRAMLASAPSDSRKEIHAYFYFIRTAATIKCYWCRRIVPKRDREVDHIIPVVRGGGTILANLCCSCSDCNRRKNDKMPEDFSGQSELSF